MNCYYCPSTSDEQKRSRFIKIGRRDVEIPTSAGTHTLKDVERELVLGDGFDNQGRVRLDATPMRRYHDGRSCSVRVSNVEVGPSPLVGIELREILIPVCQSRTSLSRRPLQADATLTLNLTLKQILDGAELMRRPPNMATTKCRPIKVLEDCSELH